MIRASRWKLPTLSYQGVENHPSLNTSCSLRAMPLNCWHHWSFRLLKLNCAGIARTQQQHVPAPQSRSRLMEAGAHRHHHQQQERYCRTSATLQRGVMKLQRRISPIILGKSWNRRNNRIYEIDGRNVNEQHYQVTKFLCQRDLKFAQDSGLLQNSLMHSTTTQLLLMLQ